MAAIQLERISRQKHHIASCLSNALPILPLLRTVEAKMDDVDLIVSSFASVSPGGIGFGSGLVEDGFNLFDPLDPRHRTISHHLAHAHCAFETSGLSAAGVLVCDYAGSTTADGADYEMTFEEWADKVTSQKVPLRPKTECISVYSASAGGPYRLLKREFCVAHPQQNIFVYHVAGLYENVSEYVFGSSQSHGQLMALAAYGAEHVGGPHDPGCLYLEDKDGEPQLRNDWQAKLPSSPGEQVKAALAFRCQEATEAALCFYARMARRESGEENLCAAGGVFLNILANTAIWRESPGQPFVVPSAPHDAGIAVGCAYYGWQFLGSHKRLRRVRSDSLGPRASETELNMSLEQFGSLLNVRSTDTKEVAQLLSEGKIIARVAGGSEFGPRALGNRSLLADPRRGDLKDKLNRIKGRQVWRPVAPIVPQECALEYFEGPPESPWMNMSYIVRPQYRELLRALSHPDNSTRPQTVGLDQDIGLRDLLFAFEQTAGVPILVNTSLNRASEPIAQTSRDAIAIYLDKVEIDFLVLDGLLINRRLGDLVPNALFRLAHGATITATFGAGGIMYCLILGDNLWTLDVDQARFLEQAGEKPVSLSNEACDNRMRWPELTTELIRRGVMVPA